MIKEIKINKIDIKFYIPDNCTDSTNNGIRNWLFVNNLLLLALSFILLRMP